MNSIDQYLHVALERLQSSVTAQRTAVETAAKIVSDALQAGRFLYAFGTGHSHLLAEEIFYRAGGLARSAAILDEALMLHESATQSSILERQIERAAAILDRYPIGPGDVLVIASNSGRNAVPVEMALIAAGRGIRTIALTSLAHSRAFDSRHPSGKKLFEVAEIVLDNFADPGDASLEVPGMPRRMGPLSTLTGAFLINAIVVRSVELAVAQGCIPEVYASSNSDVAGWNERLIASYRDRIRHL